MRDFGLAGIAGRAQAPGGRRWIRLFLASWAPALDQLLPARLWRTGLSTDRNVASLISSPSPEDRTRGKCDDAIGLGEANSSWSERCSGRGHPCLGHGRAAWGTVQSTSVHPTRFNLNVPSFSFFGRFYETRSSGSVSKVVVKSKVSDILVNKCPLLSPWDK